MTRTPRSYTDTEITEALAQLALNDGNVKRTARQLQLPASTLYTWRRTASAVADGVALTRATPERARDPVALYQGAAELAVERVTELLPDTTRLHDVAYAAKAMNDAFLDHRDGRKGTEVHVDARSVHLPALEALTSDELRALIAREAKRQEAQQAQTEE